MSAQPILKNAADCFATWNYVEHAGRYYNVYVVRFEGFIGPQGVVVFVEATPVAILGEDLGSLCELPDGDLAVPVVRALGDAATSAEAPVT